MRVIAGRLRGRPLRAPRGLTTRPTTDRAREAIFSILGPLDGKNVLDCFAGTGALGIEALSRGAARATFVECDPTAARAIRANLERLGIEGSGTILEISVERARPRLARIAPFDLVFSDPPWKMAREAALSVAVLVRGLLAPDARVLLGHPTDSPIDVPESAGLVLTDRRKWGGSGMSFYGQPSDFRDL
jgi:16S rRNA (guanine966-N2)-methyltransferase